MQLYLLVVILLFFIHHVSLIPIGTEDEALKYLTQLGYNKLVEMENPDLFPFGLEQVLFWMHSYQKTFGLKETGTLDEPTIELLNTPRCGNKDSPLSSSLLALTNSKWSKNRLR
ncbi:unnamed protein product [Didymodactylos carnosus]|uniref:Peptidoglycan binding-like domain-containing protein n=1 Tax=Didymodactylos carnosus TaxID=1234261 RepID=A0A815R5T2_9BILA|nr:unnamed protein product [Didymodactylos carnosus]CAF1552049.1 unnamed protein product [Didymodactylos carnosus]CAF4339740.1 unnamed protein product [Didymodactylos carnosus]CAF4342396.1 unnamed protein product [Didymodactylos carnosus]